MYTNFEKHRIAGLCKILADGGREGEKLCINLFEEAGKQLAQQLLAQVPRTASELKDRPGGLQVNIIATVVVRNILTPYFKILLKIKSFFFSNALAY